MKQTVEEAAKEYSSQWAWNSQPDMWQSEKDFKAGAEWQAKQSPWVSVEERLPEKDGYYLVTDGVNIVIAYFFKCWDRFAKYESYPHPFYEEGVIKAYMPIPSFD